jgi:peptide deformylase
MILPVLKYGHPALRQKGARIQQLTPAIKQLIADMLETMYAAAGIGLAAQQVGQAWQLTVIDVRAAKDRPSTLEAQGKSADVAAFMPLVLMNPEITPAGQSVVGPEGCLSFPEIYADIVRPESVDVVGMNEKGERIEFRCGGLLARAVQHEADHLQGILFIDRMAAATKQEVKRRLQELQAETKAALKKEHRR